MKYRTDKDAKEYKVYNGGKAIDLTEWFKYTCGLNSFVPAQPPEDKPIEGVLRSKHESLIELRRQFVPEMVKSFEDL